MKSVTIDDVMAWEPCSPYDRERVTELFAGREAVTALDILDMDILHGDRVQAGLRWYLIDEKTLRSLGYDFAEHVLPLFEADHPRDSRPRQLIENARKVDMGLTTDRGLQDYISNAMEAMRLIAPYPEVKDTAAGNAIQSAIRSVIGGGIIGLYPASLAAMYATRACNIGGNGKERRWQVGRIREVLENKE